MPERLTPGEPDGESAAEAFTAAQAATLLAWVAQAASARQRVTTQLQRAIRTLTVGMGRGVFYNEARVRDYAAEAAAQVRVAQVTVAGIEQAYLDRVLRELDVRPPRADVQLPQQPRGVDPMVEWQRPAVQYRYARSKDRTEDDAVTAATDRAEQLVDGDLQLAAREAMRQRLAPVDRIFGYRRIVHPELSTGGACGLCIAAADRKYYVADLLPIHLRCKCEVLPLVTGRPDPGALNPSYQDAVEAAGGRFDAASLVRVRYSVHGELGPVLTVDGQPFNGPGSAAAAAAA